MPDIFSQDQIDAAAAAQVQSTKSTAAAVTQTPAPFSPDETAAHVETAKQLNVPVPVVQADPKAAQQQVEDTSLWNTLTGDFDMTKMYAAVAHSYGADIARDDAGTLKELKDNIAKVWNDPSQAAIVHTDLGQAVIAGWKDAEYGNLAGQHFANKKMGGPDDTIPLLEEFEKNKNTEAAQAAQRNTFANIIGSAIGYTAGQAGSAGAGALTGALGGAEVGAAGGPIGAAGGAVVGSTLAVGYDLMARQAAVHYRQMELDDHNNLITEPTKMGLSILGGVAEGAIVIAGGELVGQAFRQAFSRFVSTPLVNFAMTRALGELGKAGATGAVVGAGMSLVDQVVTEAGKSGASIDKMFDTPEKKADLVNGLLQGALAGTILMGGLRVPAVGADFIADSIRQAQAGRMRDFLNEAMKAAERSKTKARSPDTVQQMLTAVEPDGQTVGINPDNIPEGKVPPGATEKQVDDARVTGSPVEVPTSTYIAHTPAEQHAAQADDVIVNGGLSVNEAKDLEDFHATNQKAAQELAAAQSHQDGVTTAVTEAKKAPPVTATPQQLQDAGLTRSEASDPKGFKKLHEQAATGHVFEGGELVPATKEVVAHREERINRELDELKARRERIEADFVAKGSDPNKVLQAQVGDGKADTYTKLIAQLDDMVEDRQKHLEAVKRQNEIYEKTQAEAAAAPPPPKPPVVSPEAARIAIEPSPATHVFKQGDLIGPQVSGTVPAVSYRDQIFHGPTWNHAWDKVVKRFPGDDFEHIFDGGGEGEHEGYMVPRPQKTPAQVAAAAVAARKSLWLDPIFKNGAVVGMSDGDFKRYGQHILDMQDAEDKKIFEKIEAQKRRELLPDYKENSKVAAQIVKQQIENLPVHQADAFFRKGDLPGGPKSERIAMDRKLVEGMHTKTESLLLVGRDKVTSALPKSWVKKGGVNPDDIAEMFGFGTGKEMVEKLALLNHERTIRNETPAQYLSTLVREEHERAMEAIYGDPDETAFNYALDAMVGQPQIDFLTQEATHLAVKAGARALTKEDIAKKVAEVAEGMPAAELAKVRPRRDLVGKLGQVAEHNLLKGKFDEAFKAKQRQAIQLGLLREGMKLQRALTQLQKKIKKYQKSADKVPGDPELSAHIQNLISSYGVAPIKRNLAELANTLTKLRSLEKIVDDFAKAGVMLDLPDFVIQGVSPSSNWGFRDFSPGEVMAFKAAIDQLDFLSRKQNQLTVGVEKRELKDVLNEFSDNMQKLQDKSPPRVPGLARSVVEAGLYWPRIFDASQLQAEQVIDWMDHRDPNGILNKALLRPLKASEARENDLLREFKQDIAALRKALPTGFGKRLGQRLPNTTLLDYKTGAPRVMTRDDLISIMLNMGTVSNFEKLTGKFEYTDPNDPTHESKEVQPFKPQDVEDFVATHARPEDFALVQGIWGIFKKLFPMADGVKYRMTGVGLEQQVPRGVKMPDGKIIQGGYYPLVADPEWRGVGDGEEEASLFGNLFSTPLPTNRYTLARTGAIYPIALGGNRVSTFGTLIANTPAWMVEAEKMIHDIAFRENVAQANQIVRSSRFKQQVDARFGPAYTAIFPKWLDYIANPSPIDPRQEKGVEKLLGTMRQRLVTVQMTLRMSTLIKHSLSLSKNALAEVAMENAGYYMAKSAAILADPRHGPAMLQKIKELSGFMRGRELTWHRDYAMEARSLQGASGWTVFNRWARAHANYVLYKADQGIANTQWLAMYMHGLEKKGFNHDDAVNWADKSVRRSHGDGGVTSLPSIMRGSELKKISTIAGQIFNEMYNRERNVVRLVREANSDTGKGNYAKAATKYWVSAVSIITIATLGGMIEQVFNNAPQKRESWPEFLVDSTEHGLESSVMYLRDAVRLAKGQPAESPMATIVQTLSNTKADHDKAEAGKKVSARYYRNISESLGYLFNIPGSGQLGITLQGLHDLNIGKEHPKNLTELMRVLAAGKARAPERKEPK